MPTYGTDAERNRAQQTGAWKPPTYTPGPLANQAAPSASSFLPGENNPTKTPATSAQIYTGYTPKYAMEGFDFQREQNTGKSAKDAFAYLSNQAPPPPINDKAALGAWFNQYIKPGMDSLGHNVLSVDGDKFRFKNWQGQFDVDYGRGAGAEGGALAWQVDDGTAQMGNGPYVPRTIGTGVDPATGLPPIHKEPAPISSAIEYRRPYGAGAEGTATYNWMTGRWSGTPTAAQMQEQQLQQQRNDAMGIRT